jgi:hypothetical protein
MIPIFAAKKLDWASAIGLFIINYGVLDWHFLVFLESRIPRLEFTSIKEKHFQDRVARMKSLVESHQYSDDRRAAFGVFFGRVDSIRILRNHIAHGHMLLCFEEAGRPDTLTLTLPKDLDKGYAATTRHLEFQELRAALDELTALIETFKDLTGGWSEEKRSIS